jgi:hypothetical protein
MPLLLFSAHPIVYVPAPSIPVGGPPHDIPHESEEEADEDLGTAQPIVPSPAI